METPKLTLRVDLGTGRALGPVLKYFLHDSIHVGWAFGFIATFGKRLPCRAEPKNSAVPQALDPDLRRAHKELPAGRRSGVCSVAAAADGLFSHIRPSPVRDAFSKIHQS
jgi:hypothetical protein